MLWELEDRGFFLCRWLRPGSLAVGATCQESRALVLMLMSTDCWLVIRYLGKEVGTVVISLFQVASVKLREI